MNWLRSLLGLAGVLFSFKGLDAYYARAAKRHKPADKSRGRQADASRQLIVEAARPHFFSHGFRSVTMDDCG